MSSGMFCYVIILTLVTEIDNRIFLFNYEALVRKVVQILLKCYAQIVVCFFETFS